MNGDLYIGLISGTSRDGVDAVLVDFSPDLPVLLACSSNPYPADLRAALDQLLATGTTPDPAIARHLDQQLASVFAAEAVALLEQAGVETSRVRAIGSHGQNVWHQPWGENPVSLQLANGPAMAHATGITVVNDFRTADVQAGGQGAPLAPLMHRKLFSPESGRLGVLNLGGIANLTLLGADGSLTGFDTGPASCLMDAWTQQHLGQEFDESGAWATQGEVLPGLLDSMLTEPYFHQAPPKSTGLELFNPAWLARHLVDRSGEPVHVQRTLAELTVRTIVDSIAGEGDLRTLLVCGGGVHNTFLMELLARQLPALEVASTASRGVDPDWVEATLFAWLARERLLNRAQDTRSITGASTPVMLGQINDP